MADRKAIRAMLREQASGFLGVEWRPRRLMDLNVLVMVMGVVDELVQGVVDLDVSGLPAAVRIETSQQEIQLAYEHMQRSRTRDHATFFREVGKVFIHLGRILEELARMERAGHLD